MTLLSLRDSILALLSPTYRAHVQTLDTLEHTLTLAEGFKSRLAETETELGQARTQIQTLTLAARNSADLASQLQSRINERDEERRWLIEQALHAAQCTTDFFARQTNARSTVFGVGPEPPSPEPAPEGQPISAGKVHARRMASAQTQAFMDGLEQDLARRVREPRTPPTYSDEAIAHG